MFTFYRCYRLCSIPLTACGTQASRSERRLPQCDSWRRRAGAAGRACWGCFSAPPPWRKTRRGQRRPILTGTTEDNKITHGSLQGLSQPHFTQIIYTHMHARVYCCHFLFVKLTCHLKEGENVAT